MKLREFAEAVEGDIHGDPDIAITGVAGIEDAKEGDITLLSSPRYTKYLINSRASCIIVKEPIKDISITQLQANNPQYVFAKAIEIFHPHEKPEYGISEKAFIGKNVKTGKNVTVQPFSHISDNVTIGDETTIMSGVFIGKNTLIGNHCTIYPGTIIRENVKIGDRVIIHSGTVIGSDGFGYVFEKGIHYKIPQVGGVIIEDDVEIGSNVSIDRATLGNTVIGRGTKIDNLVQIAHNVKIGENSLIIAQVGIAGSTKIGNYVTLAGQVGVADHTTIESGTIAAAQSGLSGNIKKGIYSGTPAIPHNLWLKAQALYARLPDMHKKIKELEERLNKLEKGEK